MIDQKTDHLALPLPHAENNLSEDVGRLREAFGKIDTAYGTMQIDISDNARAAGQAVQAASAAASAAQNAQSTAGQAQQTAVDAMSAASSAQDAAASAQKAADEAKEAISSGAGASSTSTIPTISGADTAPAGYASSYTLSSTSGLNGGEILSFDVTFNGQTWNVAASGDKATVSITIPEGTAKDAEFTITAVANDNFGGTSKPGSKTIVCLGAVSITGAEITSPAQGEQYIAIQPSVKVADMVVIGGVEDTPLYLQVQVAADASFANVVFDTGEQFAAPADLTVKVSTALELDTDYYVRARWTGTTFGQGSWGAVVAFHTIQAQVIGACQTTTGVAGQTWARLDMLGNALPSNPVFDAHPVYAGIVENLIDSQYMIGFPKCFVKREVLASGVYAGKDARFLSDAALPGYDIHPAFLAHGGDEALDMVWIGKYQASADGSKAASKSGVSPLVSIDFPTMQSRCTARNTGGVEGFHLWNIHELSLLQLLMLLEYGGTDMQTLVGRGHVDNSPSGVQQVSHATVAQASWRGLVGLWGNIWQMCDGLRGGQNTNRLKIDMGKGFVDTTIATCNTSFDPDNMINASGEGWSASHLFIGDYSTKAASTDAAAYPDTQWIYANNSSYELVTYVGGYCDIAARAGLFLLACYNYPSYSYSYIGGRLAKW